MDQNLLFMLITNWNTHDEEGQGFMDDEDVFTGEVLRDIIDHLPQSVEVMECAHQLCSNLDP